MSAEKRSAPRREMRWEGLIVDSAGTVISRCKVANVSSSGAKLVTPTPMELPDFFVLYLSLNGDVRRKCQVAWRAKVELGVKFVRSDSNEQEVVSYLSDTLVRLAGKTDGA